MNEADRPFLRHFAPPERGWINNIFLDANRQARLTDPAKCVEWVRTQVVERAGRSGAGGSTKLREVLMALDAYPDEALDLAQQDVEYLSLSDSERAAIKEQQQEERRRAWMQTQPPTEPQLAYLKRLGFEGPVGNRLEASEYIDVLVKAEGR